LLPGAAFMRAHAANTRPTSPLPHVQRVIVPPPALAARVLGRAG
jgi:hypothetical protein